MGITSHQLLGAVQVCVGVTLVARPQTVLNALAGPDTASARRIARVLGVRLTVQGAAVGLSGNDAVIKAGGAVDTVHAASMLLIAALSHSWRRAAVASAAFAGAAALASRYATPGTNR